MAVRNRIGGPDNSLARAALLALGFAAAAELALYRIADPTLSHIPNSALGLSGHVVHEAGQRAFEATAILVVACAALAAWTARRPEPAIAGALGLALASVALATLAPTASIALLARSLLVLSVAAIAASAVVRRDPRWALAHSVAVIAVLAGQWPLLVEDVTEAAGGGLPTGTLGPATVAEVAFLLATALFVAAQLRRRSPTASAWIVSAGAGVLAAVLLARHPDYAAIISTWAVGATLALPPFAYIAAASCTGLLAVEWLREPETRPLAVGLVLLATAALQPAVVHHNLTAALALAVLASPAAVPLRRDAALAPLTSRLSVVEVGGHS